MALKSFADVKAFLNQVLQDNGELDDTVNVAPHAAWWNNLSYSDFVNGNVPGVADPNTNQPIKTLVVGKSKESNIILALQGAPGTIFDPNPADPNFATFGRMPADGKAFFSDVQIKELADWIDAGCPE